MRGQVASLIALALSAPEITAAQIPEVQPGVRVRIDAGPVLPRQLIGTVMDRAGDTLVIASSATSWHRVRRDDIRRLDVSGGHSRAAGALKGVLFVGVAPTLLTLALITPQAVDGENIAFSVLISGSILGGAVGFALKTEQWHRVFPERKTLDEPRRGRSPYGTS